MAQLTSPRVWADLSGHLSGHTHIYAAISYVSTTAPKVFVPAPGSRLIVSGSISDLRGGLVSPRVLRAWINNGVEIRALRGLHAKCLVLTTRKGTRLAIVGSANASINSTSLAELSLVDDDPGLVTALEEQLHIWWMLAEAVTPAWLRRAEALYRPPDRVSEAYDEGLPLSTEESLWISDAVPHEADPVGAQASRYATILNATPADYEVYWWRLNDGDERNIRPGHTVVLVKAKTPWHANATVYPPARVVDVVPGRRGHPPLAVLVSRRDLRSVRFTHLRSAIADIDSTLALPTESPIHSTRLKQAILDLWT